MSSPATANDAPKQASTCQESWLKMTYLIKLHAALEMPSWWTNWNDYRSKHPIPKTPQHYFSKTSQLRTWGVLVTKTPQLQHVQSWDVLVTKTPHGKYQNTPCKIWGVFETKTPHVKKTQIFMGKWYWPKCQSHQKSCNVKLCQVISFWGDPVVLKGQYSVSMAPRLFLVEVFVEAVQQRVGHPIPNAYFWFVRQWGSAWFL